MKGRLSRAGFDEFGGSYDSRFSFAILLPLEFLRERLENFSFTAGARIIPQAIATMPVVVPSGVIQNRVQADAVQRNATLHGRKRLVRDVSQPSRTVVIFCACFGDEHRPLVTVVHLGKDFAKWAVGGLVSPRSLVHSSTTDYGRSN